MKTKVGILGQDGFLGTHFYNYLRVKENIIRIPSSKEIFNSKEKLAEFAEKCDVIVHFAGKSRGGNMQKVYDTNMELIRRLISSLESKLLTPLILFGSTIHENRESLYHQSKRDSHKALQAWAYAKKAKAITLIMPNVYGPYCKPDFNSFVATFCSKIANGKEVEIVSDAFVELIYVHDLCNEIYHIIIKSLAELKSKTDMADILIERKYYFKSSVEKKVTEVFSLLEHFKQSLNQNKISALNNYFELNLLNTFLSYCSNPKSH